MAISDIIAVMGILTGLSGAVIALFTARSAVNKAELESLRASLVSQQATITALQNENERLRKRLADIECAAEAKDKTIHEQATEIETLRDELAEVRAQLDEMSKRRRAK